MTSYAKHLALLAALATTVVQAGASSFAPIDFQPESRLWVDGTSTVRSYTCKATALQGVVAANGGATSLEIPALGKAVRSVDITVPVQALDCANGTMNTHMRKALKATEFPAVRFQLSQYDVVPTGESVGTVKLVGKLTIAGQEKPVTIEASVVCDGNGSLRVKGTKEILMSEYGVKPPSLMLGTMKVKDRVVVGFDVVLKQL
jgi:polyisoprenoid-binding protein YceI